MNKIEKYIQDSKQTLADIQEKLDSILKKEHYKARADLKFLKGIAKGFFTDWIHPRMLGLAGLRGTGKTTLLWQMAKYIFENDFNKDIYFFNVEESIKEGIDIFMLHKAIKKMPELKKTTVLLFDEVHEDSGWSKSIKILYDSNPAFIVCTGSSALLLQNTADLATRMHILHTFPLQFTEYINISQNKQIDNEKEFKAKLKDALFFAANINEFKEKINKIRPQLKTFLSSLDNLNDLVFKYITVHNITRFTTITDQNIILEETQKLINRVITEDIPKLIRKSFSYKKSEKILFRLAASDEINLQTLSQAIGIPKDEIEENLAILQEAELLNILYPFYGIDGKINKAKKAFFMSPSIRLAILSKLFTDKDMFMPKLYEDIVVMYLRRFFGDSQLSFASSKNSKNPDFVIETLFDPMVLEVGTNKKSVKQITQSKIKHRLGIIINAEADDVSYENDIAIVPLKWFLML